MIGDLFGAGNPEISTQSAFLSLGTLVYIELIPVVLVKWTAGA